MAIFQLPYRTFTNLLLCLLAQGWASSGPLNHIILGLSILKHFENALKTKKMTKLVVQNAASARKTE